MRALKKHKSFTRFFSMGQLTAGMSAGVAGPSCTVQGCRCSLHWGAIGTLSGGTRRCRPTNTDGLPTWDVGRDLCVPPSVQVTTMPWCGDSIWPPPSTPQGGGDGGHGHRPGFAPSADGALDDRRISRRARRGCFAGCGQRVFRPLRRATGALPLDPRIFSRKNSVKAFIFGVVR